MPEREIPRERPSALDVLQHVERAQKAASELDDPLMPDGELLADLLAAAASLLERAATPGGYDDIATLNPQRRREALRSVYDRLGSVFPSN